MSLRHSASRGGSLPGSLAVCSDDSWRRFLAFVDVMTRAPVIHGPGCGLVLENDRRWLVTCGAGRVGDRNWSVKPGLDHGPSLHCNSLINLLLGYLLNFNEQWTLSGHRAQLEELATADGSLHEQRRGGAKWRGYGEHLRRLVSDGDTASRLGLKMKRPERYLDAVEIWDRRGELATFNFFDQSDGKGNEEDIDARAGVFIYRLETNAFYRLAADGYRRKAAPRWYSGTPVSWQRLPKTWATKDAGRVYQLFRLIPDDAQGNFGTGSPAWPIGAE